MSQIWITFNSGIGTNFLGHEILIVVVRASRMLLFGSRNLPYLFKSLRLNMKRQKLEPQRGLKGFQALWMEVILEEKARYFKSRIPF